MPARTQILKKIFIAIGVLLVVAVFASVINRDRTFTYKLSNEVSNSSNGIATNTDNKGSQLAEARLQTILGETISTSSLIGAPTIINIWYSTCEPCRRELPVLAQGALKYDNKIRFVGINIKDSAKVASEFAADYGVKFEILLDSNGAFISASGISTAPVTLAVNAQGLIINQVAGELSTAKLDKLVSELLK
ncbi:MAG: TlpA disulfide reductase family protein [Actinobacteria bacterium]|nr:TlpA disulfide reductase family protein [Actinomycetota bacterium]